MENYTEKIKTIRYYGIDLFKITSMYMIVILHIILHGSNLIHNRSMGNFSNLLYILVYGAVNCFALASGYIMIDMKYKFHRILIYWCQVVFYLLIINLIFSFVRNQNIADISFINIFTPISSNAYWYFSSYFVLFLFMPFYNYVVNTMGFKQNLTLSILLLLIFSVFVTWADDKFYSTNYGYSFWWLSVMYIIGGFTKKYLQKRVKLKYAVIGFLVCNILTTSGLILKSIVPKFNYLFLDNFIYQSLSLSYNKLTVALSAWFLLIIFTYIKVTHEKLRGLIKTISAATFGVYLIHDNDIIRTTFLQNRFVWLEQINPILAVPTILGIAILVFIICISIDYIRNWIFRLIKIDILCKKISVFVTEKYHNIILKLSENS